MEQVSCAEDGGRFARGGRGGRVLLAIWTSGGRFETAVVKRGKVVWIRSRHSAVRYPQLEQDLINLAGLVTVLQGVKKSRVIGFDSG